MRFLLKIILALTLLEIFIGGGGRIFEIGPVTLRMILFLLNMALAGLLYYERGRIPALVVNLCLAVLAVMFFYAVWGFINGATRSRITEDIKPLSYFFSIVFFSFYINSEQRIRLIVSLLKQSSLFMALVYIVIQVLFYLDQISFVPFYRYIYNELSATDFVFRGMEGLFFYKGFMYMVVGLIFWIHGPGSKRKALAILTITVAMILTGTRGFIFVIGFVYLLFYGIPLILRLNIKMLILAGTVIFGSIFFFGNRDIGNKENSNNDRIEQIVQVARGVGPVSLFIGHGFGIGVPARPVHMEISVLEIFHKQGILGLSLWTLFFIILYNAYIGGKNFPDIRKSFLLSVIFMVLLSQTNPFMNNPIGISLFMISLSSFMVMNRLDNHGIETKAVNPQKV